MGQRQQSPPERRTFVAIAILIAGLTGVFAITAAWLTLDAAARERHAAEAASRHLVASVLGARASGLRDIAVEYAIWDEAYRATANQWNAAWLRQNYYSSVFDAVMVLRDGQMRYLWTADRVNDGRGALARDAVQTVRGIEALEALPAHPNASDTAISALMVYEGQLVLIAVAPIAPESDEVRIAGARRGETRNFFVGIRVLGDQDIEALARVLALDEFRFEAAPADDDTATSWPIAEMGAASSARLVWRARPNSGEPGRTLIWVLAGLSISCAFAIWAAWMVLSRTDSGVVD